jgi:hypothetical protein
LLLNRCLQNRNRFLICKIKSSSAPGADGFKGRLDRLQALVPKGTATGACDSTVNSFGNPIGQQGLSRLTPDRAPGQAPKSRPGMDAGSSSA